MTAPDSKKVGQLIAEVVRDFDWQGWAPDAAAETERILLEHAASLGHQSFGMPTLHFHGVEDQRPHSRACGWRNHPHGPECSTNCPTCHGRLVHEVQP